LNQLLPVAAHIALRQVVAQELIDFDREWAKMFSDRAAEGGNAGVDPKEFQAHFVKQGRFTAGVATHYKLSLICGEPTFQHLATGFPIGMRFHSAPVIRLVDAKPVQLGHAAGADGAWRIYAFADLRNPRDPASRTHSLCTFLETEESPIKRYTPRGADVDSVIDVRAIFQQGHRDLKVEELPSILLPRKGRFGLIDYEKAFSPDLKKGPDIFDLRGIDREKGAIVVVRPDQYVSNVLPLDAHDELTAFFGRFLLDRR